MAETKRTFEQDDLFDRKPYADFLERLILNSGSYHRDDDVQAYTIAIDSPWGTGKSVFLEKFENMLEADCPDQIRVVHYNAWKNDFWDNAFEPFADAIFSHPLFASSLGEQTTDRSIKSLGNAVKHVALAFGKKRLENYLDIEQMAKAGESLAGFVGTYTSSDPNAISPEYSAYKKNLKDMQEAIEAALQEAIPTGKLVIIIDELDRCRPTFAIETLEIVKHIMDVKDVVYIFSLDVRQLGAAIKQVYGADTDATGYLMRFFSYYSRMPVVINKKIIETMVKWETFEIRDGTYEDKKEYLNRFLGYMTEVADALALSARDLETVGKVYGLMSKAFLSSYKNSCAYLLYWFLLCAKYKNPVLFDNWIQDSTGRIHYPVPEQSVKKIPQKIIEAIQKIDEPLIIGNLSFSVREDSCNDVDKEEEKKFMIQPENKGKIPLIEFPSVLPINRRGYYFTESGDLSGVLFYKDLLNWKNIVSYTLKQYIFNQLEMFNFIPEIPTATE